MSYLLTPKGSASSAEGRRYLFSLRNSEGRETSMSSSNSANELHINDLPDGILVHVATYLAKSSVALLAIALVAPSTLILDGGVIFVVHSLRGGSQRH